MLMALSDVTDDAGRPVAVLGNLSVNLNNYRVAVGGKIVDLSFRELDLLRFFMGQPDRIIPYRDICTEIWGDFSPATLRHLHVLVHRLRVKLSATHPYTLETVRGRGYGLLKAPEVEETQ